MGEGVVKSLQFQTSVTERPIIYTRSRNKKISLCLPLVSVTRSAFTWGGLGFRDTFRDTPS